MDPNGNNLNRQFIPSDSSRTPHLSSPVFGGQTKLLMNHGSRTYHDGMMNNSFVRSEDLGIRSHPNLPPRNHDSRTYNDEMMNNSFVSIPYHREIHVREDLGQMSHYNLPPQSLPLPYPNIQARYQLQFINKVRQPTYATKPVRDNNGDPIRVEIYDSHTRSRVSPDCSLSSVGVRIIMLDADIWKNRVNWSRSEFLQNLLMGREGKEPILNSGSLTIRLENGVGTFRNLVFHDNSSWRNIGFQLGVMVDGEEDYNLTGERVQEGVSEPFQVRDRRTEASQKPDRLKLSHNAKNIKKIGKDRVSLLANKNINTVEDFLQFYYNNEPVLREILGIKSESGKTWLSMVEHVMQCDGEYQAKYNASNNSSQPSQNLERSTEWNIPLSTYIAERHVVSSGSSEPNPSENDRIEAGMPAINSQSFSDHGHMRNNVPFKPLSSDSLLNENGGLLVGLGSSESNPSENDIIEVDMPAISRQHDPSSNDFSWLNNIFESLSSDGDGLPRCDDGSFLSSGSGHYGGDGGCYGGGGYSNGDGYGGGRYSGGSYSGGGYGTSAGGIYGGGAGDSGN